jgi:hypothetical protein
MREKVGSHDLGNANGPKGRHDGKPDGTDPVHPSRHPGSYIREVNRVDGDSENFEQCSLRVSDRPGKRVTVDPRPRHPLTEASIRGSQAGKPHRGAQPFSAVETQVATSARVRRVDHDAFPAARAVLDDTCDLVARHERGLHHALADGLVFVPVEIGTTQADRRDAHQDLATPGIGSRTRLIVEAEVVPTVKAGDETQRRRAADERWTQRRKRRWRTEWIMTATRMTAP